MDVLLLFLMLLWEKIFYSHLVNGILGPKKFGKNISFLSLLLPRKVEKIWKGNFFLNIFNNFRKAESFMHCMKGSAFFI